MTQSVADKTPISGKTSRRHTDPPSLWIAVAIGSVTLHLLLFWLMRSYLFSLWSQQRSKSAVSIEFVAISRKAPSTAKPVASKLPATTQKSAPVSLPKQVTPENITANTSTNEGSNAIAFTNKKASALLQQPSKARDIEQKKVQPKSKPTIKPELTPKPEPKPEPNTLENQQPPKPEPKAPENKQPPTPPPNTNENQQPEPTPPPNTNENQQPPIPPLNTPDDPKPESNTVDGTSTDTQNQENQASGEQTPPSPNARQTDSSPLTNEEQKSPQTSETTPIRPPRQPEEDIKIGEEKPLDKQGGVIVATWDIEPDALNKDLPDNPAQPKVNIREKLLDLPSLNQDSDFQPKDFRVYLLIDNNTGKLISAEIYPQDIKGIPEAQRSQYQQYANDIFKDMEFTTASSSNGEKPRLTELVVRVKIERR